MSTPPGRETPVLQHLLITGLYARKIHRQIAGRSAFRLGCGYGGRSGHLADGLATVAPGFSCKAYRIVDRARDERSVSDS